MGAPEVRRIEAADSWVMKTIATIDDTEVDGKTPLPFLAQTRDGELPRISHGAKLGGSGRRC